MLGMGVFLLLLVGAAEGLGGGGLARGGALDLVGNLEVVDDAGFESVELDCLQV